MISPDELEALMERFIEGTDRSRPLAGRIEVGLDELFGEKEPYADLCLALASYQPGGGPYLYNDERILPMMRNVLALLRAGGDLARDPRRG